MTKPFDNSGEALHANGKHRFDSFLGPIGRYTDPLAWLFGMDSGYTNLFHGKIPREINRALAPITEIANQTNPIYRLSPRDSAIRNSHDTIRDKSGDVLGLVLGAIFGGGAAAGAAGGSAGGAGAAAGAGGAIGGTTGTVAGGLGGLGGLGGVAAGTGGSTAGSAAGAASGAAGGGLLGGSSPSWMQWAKLGSNLLSQQQTQAQPGPYLRSNASLPFDQLYWTPTGLNFGRITY